MDKRSIKAAVGIMAVMLAVGLGIYFHSRFQNDEEAVLEDPGPIYEEYVKPQVFVDNTVKVTLYLPNAELSGYVKKEAVYKGEGLEVQKQVINDLLFKYLKDKIKIPEDAAVLDLKVWNETLMINFNKAAKGIKVKDPRAEKCVIGALVNSLLTTSKEFTDVQFLVEGERVDALFGSINTRNPFMFVR